MIKSHITDHHYQKRINNQIKQFEDQRQSEEKNLHDQLQQLQQQNTDQQKQIEDLKQQVTLKKQRQAALAAAQMTFSAPVALGGDCEAYRPIIASYGWNVSIAMAVMKAESGCNPTASSPTCDHGLMQINCVHSGMVNGDLTALNDPATNVRIAFAIYQGSGWSAWTTYTSGKYLRYI